MDWGDKVSNEKVTITLSAIANKKMRTLQWDGYQPIGVILVARDRREDGSYGRVSIDNFGRVQFWNVDGSGRMYAGKESIANQTDIVQRLRELSAEMGTLGLAMEYFGGLSEISDHGRKMMGAAIIARKWVTEMEKS